MFHIKYQHVVVSFIYCIISPILPNTLSGKVGNLSMISNALFLKFASTYQFESG